MEDNPFKGKWTSTRYNLVWDADPDGKMDLKPSPSGTYIDGKHQKNSKETNLVGSSDAAKKTIEIEDEDGVVYAGFLYEQTTNRGLIIGTYTVPRIGKTGRLLLGQDDGTWVATKP